MANTPMQGMHSTWFNYYRGAVYPLDLEGLPTCRQVQSRAPTLLESCCAYIVKDTNLTRAAIESVPPVLCIHLMEAALRGNHDRAVQALLSKWRLKTLHLAKLVPNVFSSLLPLYDPLYQSDIVRQGLRYTTSLAHTFLECLRQESPTKLRLLDLTGFPTAEVILHYLTSHCMLIHNENHRNNMVTLYNQAVTLAEKCAGIMKHHLSPLEIDMHNCLPGDISIEIKLDAFVTSEPCHSELCKALTVSSFPGARFRLVVERLCVTCLGGDRVNLLLKQIIPEQLKGLQLKYNSLKYMDFVRMAPVLQSLTSLTALDLSCNYINLYGDGSMAAIVKQTLSTLHRLERLDLSNNPLKNNLATVLSGIHHPLKHLRLAACRLTISDLTALARFSHLADLEELDLSENNLSESHFPLCHLISHCSHGIRVLELQDCKITAEMMNMLLSHFSQMLRLAYINFIRNSWDTTTTLKLARALSKQQSLRVFLLSFPQDCYNLVGDDEDLKLEAEAKLAFRTSLNSALESGGQQQEPIKILLDDINRSSE